MSLNTAAAAASPSSSSQLTSPNSDAFERDLALAAALSLGQEIPSAHTRFSEVSLPRAFEAMPPAPLGQSKPRVVVSENERRAAGARLAAELAAERRARGGATGHSSSPSSSSSAASAKSKKDKDCSIV